MHALYFSGRNVKLGVTLCRFLWWPIRQGLWCHDKSVHSCDLLCVVGGGIKSNGTQSAVKIMILCSDSDHYGNTQAAAERKNGA